MERGQEIMEKAIQGELEVGGDVEQTTDDGDNMAMGMDDVLVHQEKPPQHYEAF